MLDKQDDSKVSNQNIRSDVMSRIMYDQFANQNLRLLESALTKEESKRFMVTNIANRPMNIRVVKMMADGNCLFYTLAHQLDCMKVNSIDHKNRAMQLRQQVVEYLIPNMAKYE